MTTLNDTSPQKETPEARRPRLSLATRWTSAPSRPRLVTFSWGGVAARATQR